MFPGAVEKVYFSRDCNYT